MKTKNDRPKRTEGSSLPGNSGSLWLRWIVIVSILIPIGLAYLFSPGFRASVHQVTVPLATGDLSAVEEFILSFGLWAPVISFLLMILQTLIAPLPAFVLAMANTMAFGMVYGFLLTCSSAIVAAFAAFYLSRWLGRPFVNRVLGVHVRGKLDSLIEDYGAWAVLVLRLFPLISYDAVSYFAGLSAMRVSPFALATFVGMLPATIAFSLLGNSIHSANRWSLIGGVILLGALLIAAACTRRSSAWRGLRNAHAVSEPELNKSREPSSDVNF